MLHAMFESSKPYSNALWAISRFLEQFRESVKGVTILLCDSGGYSCFDNLY